MNIVFYSHRVSYPTCLSAQVLPLELRIIAIDRLLEVQHRLKDFEIIKKNPILLKITKQQILDNVNYLQAKDQHHLWQDFLDFNFALDATRNQSLLEVVPEFKTYV